MEGAGGQALTLGINPAVINLTGTNICCLLQDVAWIHHWPRQDKTNAIYMLAWSANEIVSREVGELVRLLWK